jgi:hypothetical protein
MAQKLSNAARALITSAVITTDTTISITSSKADLFPIANTNTSAVDTAELDWFKAVLQDSSENIEIVYVRTRATGTAILSNVIRAQEDTTARNFAAGSVITLSITALDITLKAALANPVFTGTVSGVTAAMVGLGNVNNTADTAKPVSTAQAAADTAVQNAAATDATTKANARQSTLVSATNIKTINGATLLGAGDLAVGTVTSVTGTAPIISSGGTTPALSMAQATASVPGYLAAADFAAFNAKQPAGSYATGTGSASGANTGDETLATIKSKLGVTTLSGSNTGDQTISLTGGVTGSGVGSFAATVVTNANLTGVVTSVGNATSLGSFTSAQLSGALTDETGTGANVFANSPTLVTPVINGFTGDTSVINIGSGQVFKDASGNVGIGTSSPGAKLDVQGYNVTGRIKSTSGDYALLDVDSPAAQQATVRFLANGVEQARIYSPANEAASQLVFTTGTSNTERMRLNSSGNVGIGTSSPISKLANTATVIADAAGLTSGTPAIQWVTAVQGYTASFSNTGSGNQFANGLLVETVGTSNGQDAIVNFESGGVNRLKLTGAGNLGLGTSSPTVKLEVAGEGKFTAGNVSIAPSTATNNAVFIAGNAGGTFFAGLDSSTGGSFGVGNYSSVLYNGANTPMVFFTNGTERMRIDSSGNLLVGTTTSSGKLTVRATGTENVGNQIANFVSDTSGDGVVIFLSNGTAHGNASLGTIAVNKNTGTGRSINAEGTINALGADYAEYMTKSSNFTIAKGDVVGINAQGKLTNAFANAVSFVVKSTNPSFVGGDTWGSEDAIGKRPKPDAPQDEIDNFNIALEAVRALVDRIAFAGQIPVNVLDATAGQYIVPVNDNGAIKGQAVSNPTFEQYQSAVGKVIAVETDGRARIIVKIA